LREWWCGPIQSVPAGGGVVIDLQPGCVPVCLPESVAMDAGHGARNVLLR